MKKSHTFFWKISCLITSLLLVFSSGLSAQNIYINDNNTAGDAYTGAPGNDATGSGTAAAPYATLAKAMSVANSGNTIYADAGTYYLTAVLTVKAGVRIVGLCAASSIIEAVNTGNYVISMQSNTELSRVTVTRQAPGTGATTISVSNTAGATNVKVNNCQFTKCRTAVYINTPSGNPGMIIENNGFDDNRTGIVMADPTYSNVRITGNNIINSRSYGIIITGATTLSNILINNNNISDNLAGDLDVNGSGSAGAITVTNNWFGTAAPVVYAGNTNGGFSVNDHNNPAPYPYGFTDNNGAAAPNYPNDIAGTNTAAVNATSHAAAAIPFALPGCCLISSTSPAANYLSIQDAVNGSNPGATITLCAGTYNEQVLVNKSLTIKGAGTLQSIVNFTGTVSGNPTLFNVSQPNVTIENIAFKVDLTRLSSAIIATGTNVSSLTIQNNSIDAYGTSASVSSGGYGDRNAISINYTGSTNYRVAAGGVNNVLVSGNSVSGTANDGFGQSRYFRSAISMDESGGTITGNNLQSINHDVLARFGGNGPITITYNNMNGGGVELAEMNAGAGQLSIIGNNFNGGFANISAPGTAVLRLKNNNQGKTTLVTANNFLGHQLGISIENYNNVSIVSNAFTPLAGSTTYRHIMVNTKAITTNSATIVQTTNAASITSNTFNGSGTFGGTAIGFYNHDNDNAVFGTYVVGAAGALNDFNANIAKAIYLDGQSGPSSGAVFPAYTALIGAGAGATTTMAPWSLHLNAENNRFDMGSGLQTPSAMSLTSLLLLEDAVQHKIDFGTLGFVTVKPNNAYVTTNSFVSPLTTAASIQRGIDAAAASWTVNVGNGTYNGDIVLNKALTVLGQSQSAIIRGLYSGAADAVFMGTSNCTLRNVTVTRDYGSTLTDWNNCPKNQGINIAQTSTGVTIDQVRLHANRNAVFCNNAQNVTITNCIVEDNRTGLHFANNISGAQIHNNIIRNNFTHGLLFNYDLTVSITCTNAQVTNNSIAGNWYSQVNFQRNSGGPVTGDHSGLSFSCNWYGTAAPQAVAANAAEPGYTVQTPSQFGGTDPMLNRQLYGTEIARCPYTPWLISGVDDAPATAGFQPEAGACIGNYNNPVVTCPVDTTINCGDATDPSMTGVATATTNCGGTNVTYTDAITAGNCACSYVITRTWKATDGCNNQSTCTQTITVRDMTAPIVSGCPGTVTLTGCNQNATWIPPTATSGCGGAAVSGTSNHNPGDQFPAGNTTVTYTFTDANNVSSTCSFVVSVTGNVSPAIANCPANITVHTGVNNMNCSQTATWTAPTATSPCGNVPVNGTSTHAPGATFPIGVTTVSYTFTDSKGNKSTCSFTVTVLDDTKPVVSGCPLNFAVTTGPGNTSCTQTATWTPPTATDNCGGAVTMFASHQPGDIFPIGSTQVLYTFYDADSNSSFCFFYVTVIDNTVPWITTACPSDMTVYTGVNAVSCRAAVNWTPPVAMDNCSSVTTTSNFIPGANFSVGTTTVTYTFKDAVNNSTTCSFNVTVIDNAPPVAKCKPFTLTLAGGSGSVTAANIDNGSVDNCGIASRTVTPNTFTCADAGVQPVVLTVTDVNGNSSTCTSMVTVRYKPTCAITVTPSNTTYTGGVPTNIYLGYGPQSACASVAASGGSGFTYSWSPAANLSCTNCFNPLFTPTAPGTYTYNVTVTNSNGCSSVCTVTFCVKDVRVPNSSNVYICHDGAPALTMSVTQAQASSHLSSHPTDRLGQCDQTCGSNNARIVKGGTAVTGDELKVYPNPNKGAFTVELPYSEDGAQVTVTDVQGRLIARRAVTEADGQKLRFDLGDVARGMYFVEIIYADQRFRVKLIVE